ncbi:AAA family ATPase [Paenibacillus sp. LHD-117]|uniref:AAA family ATPase n=1 Tax=Paenibacillus sp. LHD-117 TaxID=3071412 RepID=UPI0027E0D632|nr:AAA family ATPase [Paenibacillus sp. LHD-117]MDQ6419038.1 AAA family ATPase [Paenibacillus sp. LHD-117]
MKLIHARIDGYGELNDWSIGLDAPVIVVYGPNEAGKSTFFGFLRTMLYGFARRSSPADRHEPSRGGRHGGRLVFEGADGRRHIVERFADSAGGKPKVRLWEEASVTGGDPSGAEHTYEQTSWEQRFLGGVQERLFRQIYAITLTELIEVNALSGGELSRYLYQAGWEEGHAVAAAEKRIQAELDELFKPKGANQRATGHAKRIEQAEAELRSLEDGIDRFNDLTREGERAGQELAVLAIALPEAEERCRLLRKALSSRPLWLRKMGLLAELERLRHAAKLHPEADIAWNGMTGKRRELQAEAERLRKELEQLEGRKEALRFDETRIAKGDETDAMLQSEERMRSLASQRGEWQTELDALDGHIAKLVAGISPEWTERQLRELCVTVADRDYVRDTREKFAEAQRREEKLLAERETFRGEEREAAAMREEAAGALRRHEQSLAGDGRASRLLPLAMPELANVWMAVDDALRFWELERARSIAGASDDRMERRPHGDRRAALTLWGSIGMSAAAALCVVAAAGWLGQLSEWALAGAAVVGGVSAALLAAATFVGGRSRPGGGTSNGRESGRRGRSYAPAEKRLGADQAEAHLATALALLVRQPEAALSALLDRAAGEADPRERAELQASVQARQEQFVVRDRLSARLAEQDQRLSRLRASLAERDEALLAAAADKQTGASGWGDWLTVRSLPRTLSPSGALESFELAEGAIERLRQYDRLSARLAAAEKEASDYTAHAVKLCEGFEDGFRQSKSDPTLALKLLQADIRRHAAVKAEAEALHVHREELASALASTEEELAKLASSIRAVMAEADVGDEPRYEAVLRDRGRLSELEAELARTEIELTAGQTEERLSALERLWETNDEQDTERALEAEEREAARLAEAQRDWLERRGRVKQATEHLMNEEKRGQLLAEREMAVSSLDADTDRYAVLAVGRALIRQTRKRFEEERQPVVLRNASSYMSLLTDGRYTRVHASDNQAGVTVERSDQTRLDGGRLSRGTAEQLYLSMRLALAQEAAGSARLPMLLDDLFVNFDRVRLRAAAGLINSLSEERQLLLFTCHEHVRDELLAACEGARLVDMTTQRA